MVQENDFREDLFYLLNTITLTIPPLRQRRDDISSLTEYFIKKNNEQFGTRKTICLEVLNIFMKYVWPGNVRELENLLGKLMITSNTNVISINDLPEYLLFSTKKDRHKVILYDLCSLKEANEQLEKQLLEKAYNKYKTTYRMAEALGVNQSTVVRKMKRYLNK
jgi:transcriptional regulator with PAS, ATPase and Fis domain